MKIELSVEQASTLLTYLGYEVSGMRRLTVEEFKFLNEVADISELTSQEWANKHPDVEEKKEAWKALLLDVIRKLKEGYEKETGKE